MASTLKIISSSQLSSDTESEFVDAKRTERTTICLKYYVMETLDAKKRYQVSGTADHEGPHICRNQQNLYLLFDYLR